MIVVPFKEFEFAFHSLVSDNRPFLAWFTAEKDEKGDTWCADCKDAAVYLDEIEKQGSIKGIKLYVFQIGPREGYKSPDFTMRTNKLIKLKCIPTLAYFDGTSFVRRLQEKEILSEKNRKLILEDDQR